MCRKMLNNVPGTEQPDDRLNLFMFVVALKSKHFPYTGKAFFCLDAHSKKSGVVLHKNRLPKKFLKQFNNINFHNDLFFMYKL